MSVFDSNKQVITKASVEMKRSFIRESLSEIYLPYYDKLIELLDSNIKGDYWAPYMGNRSLDEQTKLYAQGRTAPGFIVTRAQPGSSAHNWQLATDFCEFRPEFVNSDVFDKANWEFYAECVRGSGLIWGGDWKSFPDRPHNEIPLKVSFGDVGRVYRDEGLDAAFEFIKNNLKEST